jgi:uncharacterized protein (TIGR00725 family)
MRRQVVAVIGAGDPSPRERDLAFQMGTLIARAGYALVTGGLGGVMEEASRGAREAGGTVLGIVPLADPEACNLHVDYSIATGLGEARNVVIANTADIFVAIGGSFGTLSEIAFALKRGKTVIGLSTWKLDPSRLRNAAWTEVTAPEDAIGIVKEKLEA